MTIPTPEELARLREAAEKAKSLWGGPACLDLARFEMRANPSTILALLDDCGRMKEALFAIIKVNDDWKEPLSHDLALAALAPPAEKERTDG